MPSLTDLQNTDAERMILSSVLLDPDSLYELMPILEPDMFYSQQYRLVYNALLSMAALSTPIDMVTLTQYLKSQGLLEKVGGISAIAAIAGATYTATHIKHYAQNVASYYRRRQLLALCEEMADMTVKSDDTDAITANLSLRLTAICTGKSQTISNMHDTCLNMLNWLTERADAKCPGIMSGIAPLDVALHGWQRKDLIILAARPSMGKTALCQTFAVSAAKHGQKVLFFSLEMGLEQIGARLTSMVAHVPMERMFNPSVFTQDEYDTIITASEKMAKWPLYIDDKSGQTPLQMLSKARQVQGKYGLDLIIIDYLQIIGVEGKRENRTQEISYISASLKSMAKELNVPVIALSQLSRDVEKRADKRPMMSDLRDGGTIEQDADIIITLYRDKYYHQEIQDDVVELDVKKNRNGKLTSINLRFVPEFMRFESLGRL